MSEERRVRGAGFTTVFKTELRDYQLSFNKEYMKIKIFHKTEGGVMVCREYTCQRVKEQKVLEQLKSLGKRWKAEEGKSVQGHSSKYVVYSLRNKCGARCAYYKVYITGKKTDEKVYPGELRYYKKV